MKNKETLSITIEKYLNGLLQNEELKDFEIRIKSNSKVAEQVRIQKGIQQVVKKSLVQDFDSELSDIFDNIASSENYNNTRSTKIPLRAPLPKKWLRYAASILFIISGSIALAFYHANNNYSNTSLANLNQEEWTTSLSSRSSNTAQKKNVFQSGITAIKDQKYNQALSLFNQLNSGSEEQPKAQLFLAFIHLKQNKYTEAEKHLQEITSNHKGTVLAEQAEWLQIQKSLLLENQDEVQFLLLKITRDKDHYAYQKAIVLQQKLNSYWRQLTL